MEFTLRKNQVGNKPLKIQLKNDSVLNACATYVILKTKMQKIGHENLSLHTSLINSFLSNFISFLVA